MEKNIILIEPLTKHLKNMHEIDAQEYYDKYLKKEENEELCAYCNKPSRFINLEHGYTECCSRTCTNLLKYGADHPTQSEKIKNKIKQSNLKNYGVECTFQSEVFKEKSKQTCLQQYGFEFASQSPKFKEKVKQTNSKKPKKQKIKKSKPICKLSHEEKQRIALEKRKNTNRERFGYDFASQSPEVKKKAKQTNLKKYGVDSPAKSDIIKNKVRKYFENKYGEGVTNPGLAPEIREKISKYYEDKYGEGITSYFQTDEFKEKSRQTRIKNFGQDVNI